MSFLTLLKTLHRAKNELNAEELEALKTLIESNFGEEGLLLLQKILIQLRLIQVETQGATNVIPPHHSADQYPNSYNHSLYEIVLPICQMAYLEEQNGLPQDHAFKLATLFSDAQDVINYLARYKFTNSFDYLVHDACLFDLPEADSCNFIQWRAFAKKHLSNPRFRELLPHAAAIEKTGQTGKYYSKLPLDRAAIQQKKQQLSHASKQYKDCLTKPVINFNEEQRLIRQERLSAFNKAKSVLRLELADLCKGLPLQEADMLVLESFYASYKQQATAYQFLVNHGISDKNIARFKTLARRNDNSKIPDILIDGKAYGYPNLYLTKLDILSDEGAALAAALGKIPSIPCCQYLGGAGSTCTEYGISSPYSGFYILFRGDADNPSLDDPVNTYCWTWMGEEGELCVDSTESESKHSNELKATIELFRILAHQLCQIFNIPKVNIGTQSGISWQVGSANYFTQKVHFRNDYKGYHDSKYQLPLANTAIPYLFYDPSEQSAMQTLITKDTIRCIKACIAISEPLKTNTALQQVISFALNNNLPELLELVKQAAKHSARPNCHDELSEILNINKRFNEQLNKGEIDFDALNQGAYVDMLNSSAKTALYLAARRLNIQLFNRLMAYKPNLDFQYKNRNTLVHVLLKKSHCCTVSTAMISTLIEAGAALDIKNDRGKTALATIIGQDNLPLVQKLIEHDAKAFNICMKTTALFIAAKSGSQKIFNYLFSQQYEINIISHPNQPNLLWAAIHGHNQKIIKKIVSSSFCNDDMLSQKDDEGRTPLVWAAEKGQLSTLGTILTHSNCSTNLISRNKNLLLAAVKGKNQSLVQWIVSNPDCDEDMLNLQDDSGRTALTLAAEMGEFTNFITILNETPHRLLIQNKNLLAAAIKGQNEDIIIKILSRSFCNLEMLTQRVQLDETVLIWAVKAGRLNIVKAILNNPNCSPDLLKQRDGSNKSALDWADEKNNVNIAKAILSSRHGKLQRPVAPRATDDTCCKSSPDKLLSMFFSKNERVELVDETGETAFLRQDSEETHISPSDTSLRS